MIPETRHIGAWLQAVAACRSHAPALIDVEGSLSWGDFARRLRQVGNALLDLGLVKGDRVALILPDTRTYLEADYGTMSAGLVRVPMDPRLPAADIAALLKSSGARAVITTGAPLPLAGVDFVLVTGGAVDGALDFDALVAAASDTTLPPGDPEDLATLNYSGGTTGAPKGIALRHCNLAAVMRHTIDAFAITDEARFLNVRPLWPIAQVVAMAHLAAGGALHLGGRFEPERFGDLVAASGATRTSLVPTQLFRALDQFQPGDARFSKLEAIYIGGSRLPSEIFTRALETIGPKVGVLYGMTEAPISCYLAPAMVGEDATKMASVGRPVRNVAIQVIGPDGPTSAPGIVGEVVIRGDHVMLCYWQNPEASAAALKDGWLHTGDLGTFDAEGCLSIVGRLKEIIRTGATSVVPAEVEDMLMRHEAVADAAVIGLPDPEWGEAVTGFVVLKPDMSVDASALIRYCKAQLAGFEAPRAIHFREQLPRSHYGKILRAELLRQGTD